MSFRRARFQPRGGPDGGNGGDGGALIFMASRSRNTLVDFRRNKRYAARNGLPGEGQDKYGAAGADLVIEVPVGTVLYDADTDEQLADLDTEGKTLVMPGGKGGAGNLVFKTSTNRTPRTAQAGLPGEEKRLRLELKLIADVGLLGFPNAGKSTFIAAVTSSKSRVGAHPFTTLTPQLGVVPLSGHRSFVIADIPGLIEGAASGAGLGHEFLRHVERCSLYLHLLAPEDWEGDPAERWTKLNAELREYEESLMQRPQLIVLTKADLITDDQREALVAGLKRVAKGRIFVVSALTQEGIPELIDHCWQALVQLRGQGSDE